MQANEKDNAGTRETARVQKDQEAKYKRALTRYADSFEARSMELFSVRTKCIDGLELFA
jgi:hypothetical protein